MFKQNVISCQLCNRPIYGQYLQYSNGLVVCEQCEQTTTHCACCKLPSHQLTPVRGMEVCPACLKAMPVCDCCHIPILESYSVIEGLPGRYCETCMKMRPRCGVCNAPLNEQGRIFRGSEGETRRCGNCLRTAITTHQQAETLYRQVQGQLVRELSITIDVLPPLTLVSRERLAALHGQTAVSTGSNLPSGGEVAHLQGFFQRVNDRQHIYVEHYLPQAQFQSVAAHELAHAWQAMHTPHNQPERIVEGFAEWVAYSILQALGESPEAERLTKRNDLYGEGLRYFLDLERRRGRQAVLERAQRR